MSLSSFKLFVKNNPSLASFVTKKEMTWQGFYELFDLYGESSSVWDKYLKPVNNTLSFKDLFGMFKNIDVNEVQKGISSLQKGIDYVKDIVKKDDIRENTYEKRPIYKKFDD